MSRKKKLTEQVLTEHAALKAAVQAAEALHAALTRNLDAALAQTVHRIENEHAAAVQQANSALEQARQAASRTLQAAVGRAGLAAAPWSAPGWNTWTPPSSGSPPPLLRLGELHPEHIATRLPPVPALLPLIGGRHILVSFEDTQSRLGAGILESLAWRIAALSPPGSYRFVLMDPLDRGANLASLLKLPEAVRGQKIWCDDQEMEAALKTLMEDVEEVIQRRLLNTYPDIEAYNSANPDVAVPYCFLVLVGFPRGVTPRAADLLFSLARTGRRAGCYILGGVLRGERPPQGFDFPAFMKQATYISVKGAHRIEWNDPEFARVSIQPDPPPPAAWIDRIARTIQSVAATSASLTIPFRRIAVRKAHWWEASSAGGLEADLGIDEAGRVYRIAIGQGVTHHALVGGATGTGKTNLLHLLVLMLSTAYSPQELELYLVDFKEGVEFQDYVTYALPHARAVVLEAEREFGLSVLQHLVEEMERRGEAFKAAGVNDIQEYRRRTGRPMPRILLIMDEYVVLFSEDDRLSFQASEALGALVMRGRSFGIHVLLSAQRPASTFLSMSHIKSQMGLRIAFKCRPEDSTLILGEGNEQAARLAQAGQACVTSDPDRIDATIQVRVAYVTPDERALYLRGLQEFARLKGYVRTAPLILFSRNTPAVWSESRAVAQWLGRASQPLPLAPLFWLGQPMRIADDIAIALERQQGANLLVLGSDENLALRLLFSGFLGLLLTTPPSTARFLIVGTLDPRQPAGQILSTLQNGLPSSIQVQARQAAVETLNALVAELDDRLSQIPPRPSGPIFLMVAGLHRWPEARGPNPYTPSPVGEALARLAEQGPLVGIHTLMWCDRLGTLGAAVGTGTAQDLLSQFGHRVALQMSADESVQYLGGPYAAKLGSERAYYRNEQWPADVVEKFKPYAWPSPSDLDVLLATLRSR